MPCELGSTAIGIQTAEGIVLAVEKRIDSKLLRFCPHRLRGAREAPTVPFPEPQCPLRTLVVRSVKKIAELDARASRQRVGCVVATLGFVNYFVRYGLCTALRSENTATLVVQ